MNTDNIFHMYTGENLKYFNSSCFADESYWLSATMKKRLTNYKKLASLFLPFII